MQSMPAFVPVLQEAIAPIGARTQTTAQQWAALNESAQLQSLAAALAQQSAAAASGGAFAQLHSPPAPLNYSPGADMQSVGQTVSDAMREGVTKPHLQALHTLLEHSLASGRAVPTEQLMLVSLQLQQGQAISAFITQAVQSTRQSVQTLVERS